MNTPLKRDRSNRGNWWTLARRRWAYGLAVAIGGALVTFGFITGEQAVALGAVCAALFGVAGLALANPTDD